MSSRLWAVSGALAALLPASHALAETTVPPRSRIYAGSTVSIPANPALTIDGRKHANEGGAPGFALTAGYLQRLLPHVGVVVLAGIGTSMTTWAEDRGETRTRADLA